MAIGKIISGIKKQGVQHFGYNILIVFRQLESRNDYRKKVNLFSITLISSLNLVQLNSFDLSGTRINRFIKALLSISWCVKMHVILHNKHSNTYKH